MPRWMYAFPVVLLIMAAVIVFAFTRTGPTDNQNTHARRRASPADATAFQGAPDSLIPSGPQIAESKVTGAFEGEGRCASDACWC